MEIELNKPDWFETQVIVETEGFDKDQYGNTWYSVKFVGDASTFLWLAKDKPEEHKKYYGHIEATKSGKAFRFKKDSVPEGEVAPVQANDKQASYAENPDKQRSINRCNALNNAVLNNPLAKSSEVIEVAEVFYAWLQNETPEASEELTDPLDRPIYDTQGVEDETE